MPAKKTTIDLIEYFSDIEDPRIDRQKLHPLPDILFVVFTGVICGVESWADFVLFAESKLNYLRKYVPLKNGIPSKNTFQRVITRLEPEAFRECFLNWVDSYQQELGDVIAIDGKTLRRSFDKAGSRSPIHMISAFASEARLVLAQEKVAEKSNEITAIPNIIEKTKTKTPTITLDQNHQYCTLKQFLYFGAIHAKTSEGTNLTRCYTLLPLHFPLRKARFALRL